ncbi:hypothetical protein GW17_00020979, partial [Ensete ventricosum]
MCIDQSDISHAMVSWSVFLISVFCPYCLPLRPLLRFYPSCLQCDRLAIAHLRPFGLSHLYLSAFIHRYGLCHFPIDSGSGGKAQAEMKLVAAYLLGGNSQSSAGDLRSILESRFLTITFCVSCLVVGAEAEEERIDLLLFEVKGKDIAELIAAGRKKFASVPSGGADRSHLPSEVLPRSRRRRRRKNPTRWGSLP